MKKHYGLVLLVLIATSVHAEDAFQFHEKPPRLAVFPFLSDKDPEYGLFMANRLTDELIQYRDIPAWQGRWFELVEPDTIPHGRMQQILETQQAIKGNALHLLRTAANADLALIGHISFAGARTLHLCIINLQTGEPMWRAKARDDVKWQWIYAQHKTGEIALGNIISQLWFKQSDRHGVVITSDELPLRVGFSPLYSSQKAIVGSYNRLIRKGVENNNLFGQLQTIPTVGERIGKAERAAIAKQKGIDAVLCGNLLGMGKDNAVNAVAVTLRLVAVPSGRILWAGSASARRVWRKDQYSDLTQSIATDLVTNLAKARTGTRTEWANLPEPKDGPRWIERGMAALERGLLDQAEEAFLNAEKFPDSQTQAYEGLARIYARRPALRQRAVDYYYKALKADSTRADLYYELASVYFDIGTGQCLDMAKRAIAIDSTYSSAYRLIGDWYARDNWYALPRDNAYAAAYYTRYLQLEPDDIDVAAHLGKVLLRMNDDQAISQLILPLIAKHPEATDLLPIAAQRAFRLAQYDTAAAYWNRYLTHTDDQTRTLYLDPTPILSDAQRAAYAKLSDVEKQSFVDQFWQQKDLDPTTVVNERLLEHYQRVWISRRYFAKSVYPWDRRGSVYLRYGEPDYRSRSGRTPGAMPSAVQQIKDKLYADLYSQPADGALVGTVFPVRSSREIEVLSPSGDVYTQGDAYMPVTSGEDYSQVPWESWDYVTVGGGMEFTFTDEMGSGHFDFAPTPLRLSPGMRSISRLQEHAPEQEFARAASEMPEQYRPWWKTRDLEFYYDVSDFRNKPDTTRVDVAFGLPTDAQKTGHGDLTLAAALYDSTAHHIFRQTRQVIRADSTFKPGAMLTQLLTLDAPPGDYQLTVKAENASANRVSVLQQQVQVEAYGHTALQICDLVLAARIDEIDTDSPFRHKNLRIVPLPTRAFLAGQDLGLYFEVYNLTPDDFGQVHYRVTIQIKAQEQTEGLRHLLSGQQSKPEVSLTFEQVDSKPFVQVYQFIDLTKARSGRNRLAVTVEDLNAKQSATKETAFRYGK